MLVFVDVKSNQTNPSLIELIFYGILNTRAYLNKQEKEIRQPKFVQKLDGRKKAMVARILDVLYHPI
jgi:hypothetical protein